MINDGARFDARRLRVDGDRRFEDGGRLPDRLHHRHDDVRRDLRVADPATCTIGYMADDDGYNRFFSYILLFSFSMLMLVMSDNLLQLFFGWEAVGLVS